MFSSSYSGCSGGFVWRLSRARDDSSLVGWIRGIRRVSEKILRGLLLEAQKAGRSMEIKSFKLI